MVKNVSCGFMVLFLILGSGILINNSADASSREETIEQEMDCINQRVQDNIPLEWEDVCYADTQYVSSSKDYSQTSVMDRGYAGDEEYGEESEQVFSVNTEVYNFRYAEPDFIKQNGTMYGVSAVYTRRFSFNEHIQSWKDVFTDDNKFNMVRIDGRFGFGDVDYESEGTGTADGQENILAETRGVLGYDLPFRRNWRVTPYFGFGYRYLYNDTRGTSSTGALGYRRESNYFYSPAGIEINKHFTNKLSLTVTTEYDFFWGGKQKSHLDDAIPGIDTVTNSQKNGYGLRGSIRVAQETDKFGVFIEPFINYWKIEDSDVSAITYSGVIIGYGLEPHNNTMEWGLKLGMNF